MNEILKALENHEPIVVNYGKGSDGEDIKEISVWNSDKGKYISETGEWNNDLLNDIANNKVKGYSIELMQDE